MQDFEKLGVFYLGKEYDLAARSAKEDLVLYDSRDLVTHAVCVGMTGSGKTGLCIALLEEAAIDGIPAIVIDPKGDLANLLLTFPELRGADFLPWVNEEEARRKGVEPAAFAEAAGRRSGRRGSPSGARTASASGGCARRRSSRSTRRAAAPGIPLSILKSFPAPREGRARGRRPAPRARRDDRDEPAGAGRRRRRPRAEPRAHPALDDPRQRLAAGAGPRPRRRSSSRSRTRPCSASASSTWSPSSRRRSASAWR